jgi:hypothetical protein
LTEGGWRFVVPVPGMMLWQKSRRHWLYWEEAGWSDGELRAKSLIVNDVKSGWGKATGGAKSFWRNGY